MFFNAQQSSELMPEHAHEHNLKSPSSKKNRVLREKTPSDLNRDNGDSSQPTIRLVDSDSSLKTAYTKNPFPQLPSQVLQPPRSPKTEFSTQPDDGYSGLGVQLHSNLKLPPNTVGKAPQGRGKSYRMSNTSDATTTSAADTLCNESSGYGSRFSQDATVRNTPTPLQSEERDMATLQGENLPRLVETSFETSTIRPVTASSPPDSQHSNRTWSSTQSSIVRGRVAQFEAQARLAEQVTSPSLYSSSPREIPPSSPSWNVIRYSSSNENNSLNVQYAQTRPPTAQSQSASSTWSSGEDDNALPSLSVARRRRHMHSASLGANQSFDLPTIVSESDADGTSRSTLMRLSRTPSSDIFTSTPAVATATQSDNWYVRRRTIAEAYPSSPPSSAASSQWDLTQGDFSLRQPSSPCLPQTSSGMVVHPSGSVYELPGDLPSEQDDTIAELNPHIIRKKKSAHHLRARALSEPRPISARSNQTQGTSHDSNRNSQGSSIFPVWAKVFYRGKEHFESPNDSARASIAYPDEYVAYSPTADEPSMMPWPFHRRWQSAGDSLNGTSSTPGYGNTSPNYYVESPASSHFLPSVFRALPGSRDARERSRSTGTLSGSGHTRSRSGHTRSSSLAIETYMNANGAVEERSTRENSSHSMEITPVIVPRVRRKLPKMRNPSRERQRLPPSHYPAPMSHSHMYNSPPHLQPSRRLSHRLSAWRAPSFDEAMNTLLISRCNRQILLFCLGFICPFMWFFAAVLPLPLKPGEAHRIEASNLDLSDLEGEKGGIALGARMERFDWEQEKRYLKATWWRNLNRIMSVVGVGIIAAVIALAVIAYA